jgi:hypothetical protein
MKMLMMARDESPSRYDGVKEWGDDWEEVERSAVAISPRCGTGERRGETSCTPTRRGQVEAHGYGQPWVLRQQQPMKGQRC